MRAVHDLELLVTPGGALCSLVRAVTDLDRILAEGIVRIVGVEDELGHLPVALVRVVEIVERVEEPVLEGELPGVTGIRRDVRVHGRRRAARETPRPELVVAPGVERVAGKVEVVLVAVDEVARRRSDLDEIRRPPGAAQRHGRLVEEHVDVGRDVGLPRAALHGLIDEADNRCEPVGECLLVPGVRRSDGYGHEGERGQADEEKATKCD